MDKNDKDIAESLAGVLSFTLRLFTPSKGLRVFIAVRDMDNGSQYEIANVSTREEMVTLASSIYEGVRSKVRVAGVGAISSPTPGRKKH